MLGLAWKNIIANPFSTILSVALVSLSVGMVVFFAHLNRQFQKTMDNNTAGVHLILAAKGSPLQSVLCNLYHVDNPTGNIKVEDAKAFFNPKHPLIKQAIPMSLGDNYRSYRIVGTTRALGDLYDATIAEGNWWHHRSEIVVGAHVAEVLNLKIGDVIKSSHGLVEDGMDHTHDNPLTIVGILNRSGSVIDNLLLTNFGTIWDVHSGHDHDHGGHDHDHAHDHHDHDHAHHDGHDHHHDDGHLHFDSASDEIANLLENPGEAITSVLLTFKNHNHQTLNMMRAINENSTMQAAHPAWELGRLYDMTGSGTTMLSYLAWIIGGVSVLSIFLSLLQHLRSRKVELAILRVLGSRPRQIFGLILSEGILQMIIGLVVGIFLAHVGLMIVDQLVESAYRYNLQAWRLMDIEWKVGIVTLLLGALAAIWPAYLAYKTDVSRTLQEA